MSELPQPEDKRFSARHLARLEKLLKFLDARIESDLARGAHPHGKLASRSAVHGVLEGARRMVAVEKAAFKLLEVVDKKVPALRSAKTVATTCDGCGVVGLAPCKPGCWVNALRAAADELDQVLP